MNTSERGVGLIKEFESCRLEAYDDGGGVWTIGWGTTRYPNGRFVAPGDVCTQQEADQWLMEDIMEAEDAVDRYVSVPINQNQFDALVSFTYNCGSMALLNSTLLKLLNARDDVGAARQFKRWNKDNGKEVAGLTRRRAVEAKLFSEV